MRTTTPDPKDTPSDKRFAEADHALIVALNQLEAAIERARIVIASRTT